MKQLLVAVGMMLAGVGLALASPEADMLWAHYPHGVHKLRTDKGSEKITWDSEVLAGDGVKRETLTFANLDEFQAALLKANLNQAAYIEIAPAGPLEAGMARARVRGSTPHTANLLSEGLNQCLVHRGLEANGLMIFTPAFLKSASLRVATVRL